MEDLLQSRIQDACSLSLPEGLRDLMCDISREVLRAQPTDLYKFIVDYLAALLLARDTLPIACQVCCDVCDLSCEPLLEEELGKIGLEDDDLEIAKNMVIEHFDNGEVNEGDLLMKLFHKTKFDDNMLPAIQEAVRNAFLRHRLDQLKVKRDMTSKEGREAAEHTLRFYDTINDNEDLEDIKHKAATKIQACYRGYLTRRCIRKNLLARKKLGKPVQMGYLKPSYRIHMDRLSSTSLAGSLIHLPKYVPYSPHDTAYADLEYHERENTIIDYTLLSHIRDTIDEGEKIVFHKGDDDLKSCSIDEEDTNWYVDEELKDNDVKSEASSIEESIITARPFAQPSLHKKIDEILETIRSGDGKCVFENTTKGHVPVRSDYKLNNTKGKQENHIDKSLDSIYLDEENKPLAKLNVKDNVTLNRASSVAKTVEEEQCSTHLEDEVEKGSIEDILEDLVDKVSQYEKNCENVSDTGVIEEACEIFTDNGINQAIDGDGPNKPGSLISEPLNSIKTSELKLSGLNLGIIYDEHIGSLDQKVTEQVTQGSKTSNIVIIVTKHSKENYLTLPFDKIAD